MKKVHVNLLKKFDIEDIKHMRELKRQGLNNKEIADMYDCATTTVLWHTGDILLSDIVSVY